MKKLMIAIIMMVVAINSHGAGLAQRIKYHYATTVSPTVPELSTLVELRDDSDGQGVKMSWKTAYAPSKATLQALDDATVEAWVKEQDAEEAASLDKAVSAKLLKAIVLVLADETGNTPAQIKAKIKAKYETLP